MLERRRCAERVQLIDGLPKRKKCRDNRAIGHSAARLLET